MFLNVISSYTLYILQYLLMRIIDFVSHNLKHSLNIKYMHHIVVHGRYGGCNSSERLPLEGDMMEIHVTFFGLLYSNLIIKE
jgi:hypothetical protein